MFKVSNNFTFYTLTSCSLLGILFAIIGLLNIDDIDIIFTADSKPVAVVNNVNISMDKYNRMLNSLANDKRDALSADDKAYILERLIDEELLVQRGVELGMLGINGAIRSIIVKAVIGSVIADTEFNAPDDEELLKFFTRNKAFFSTPSRLRLQKIHFAQQDSETKEQTELRALHAYDAIQDGNDFIEVSRQYGNSVVAEIPDVLLPPSKIREYIGPGLLTFTLKLKLNEISKPIKIKNGFHILQLIEREDLETPIFEEVKDKILIEYKKRKDDETLREYLEWLKQRADISRLVLEK